MRKCSAKIFQFVCVTKIQGGGVKKICKVNEFEDFGLSLKSTIAVGAPLLKCSPFILPLENFSFKVFVNFSEMLNNLLFEEMVNFDYDSPLDVRIKYFGTFKYTFVVYKEKYQKIF